MRQVTPEDKARIKEIMRSTYVNGPHLKRITKQEYIKEFKRFMRKYPGINFKDIYIHK